MRSQADFANFRKRIDRERLEWALQAQVGLLEIIVPALQDIARTLGATQLQASNTPLAAGLELVHKNLQKQLALAGIEEITASGVFTPELHEAVAHVDSTQHESGQIVHEVSRGYRFKGRIIKHAQVAVAR